MATVTIILTVLTVLLLCFTIIATINDSMTEIIFGFMFMVFLIISFFNVYCVIGSKNKANFYNTVYKTNYTADDIYWNGDIINNYIIGEKKNFNLKIIEDK